MDSTSNQADLDKDAAMYALAGRVVAYVRAGVPITQVSLWPSPVNGKAGDIRTQQDVPSRTQFAIEATEAMAGELPRWMAAEKYPYFAEHAAELSGRGWDGVSAAERWTGLEVIKVALQEIVAIAEALQTSNGRGLTGHQVRALIKNLRPRDDLPPVTSH